MMLKVDCYALIHSLLQINQYYFIMSVVFDFCVLDQTVCLFIKQTVQSKAQKLNTT